MTPRWVLHRGDCIEALRAMPDSSVDSVVTDPPYGLSDHKPADVVACLTAWLAGEEYRPNKKGFMGRAWDSWVPGPEVWREVFRVLKPGGHVVAFAGSRTHDLMSMALRLAGFECRDTVMWVYGSGFPKSLDVSKAIDKRGGASVAWFGPWFRKWREGNCVTQKQVAELFPSKTGGLTGCVANWELGLNMPTPEQFNLIRDTFGLPFASIEEAEREVVGVQKNAMSGWSMDGSTKFADRNITAPATDAARQWSGWGTALKPAFEPALLFRKPLDGNVAENVLAHGTGALNIDGCRVPAASDADAKGYAEKCASVVGLESNRNGNAYGEWKGGRQDSTSSLGRFPSNVIHDGSDEVLALFPDSDGAGPSLPRVKVTGYGAGIGSGESAYLGGERIPFDAGRGSAARFFYCPKANRKDRNEGCEGLPQRVVSTWGGDKDDLSEGKKSTFPKGNHHPTVKPTDLMRYLCRLVTPPGGVVLDPFTGSGSTGKAAILEGFSFIGCELLNDHADIAEARIQHALDTAAQDLFFGIHQAA